MKTPLPHLLVNTAILKKRFIESNVQLKRFHGVLADGWAAPAVGDDAGVASHLANLPHPFPGADGDVALEQDDDAPAVVGRAAQNAHWWIDARFKESDQVAKGKHIDGVI